MKYVIGSQEAREKLERLYNKYRVPLYYVAKPIVKDHASAEDAVQITFEKVARHLHKIDEENEQKTRGFLNAICRNVAKDIYNERMKLNTDADLVDEADLTHLYSDNVYHTFISNETLRHLVDMIKKLEPIYQNTFIMKYIAGYSYEEIAQAQKVEPATVRKRMERAKQKLGERVKKEELV